VPERGQFAAENRVSKLEMLRSKDKQTNIRTNEDEMESLGDSIPKWGFPIRKAQFGIIKLFLK